MAHKSLVPKQRILTESESQTSFESWREAIIFHISLDNKSARFLSDLNMWTLDDSRGFQDDPGDHRADVKMNKESKAALLNIILGLNLSCMTKDNRGGKVINRQATSMKGL